MNNAHSPKNFRTASKQAIDNNNLRRILNHALSTTLHKRGLAVSNLPQWEQMRQTAHHIKKIVVENLDYYLAEFIKNAESKGTKIFYAEDSDDACNYILQVAREKNARLIVKSKSMVTEEIHLNDKLENAGIEVVETDLGEFIAQLNNQPPSHITAPIIHLSRQDVGRIYQEKFQIPYTEDASLITAYTRKLLREKFFRADMGISGANFAIADTGSIVIVENEGNVRMVTTAPKVHIAVMGMEKFIRTITDLPLFLRLLSVSGTGQLLTNYVSIIHSARKPGEHDGPEELHIVILDNGRSGILEDSVMREALYCIRCGSCMNVCPVYSHVGGHAYGSVYPGPIGSVLTPLFQGLQAAEALPFASTLCGYCFETCPVKIKIHHLLLHLRNRIAQEQLASFYEKIGFHIWLAILKSSGIYRFTEKILRSLQNLIPGTKAPYIPEWSKTREFPRLAKKSFYQLSEKLGIREQFQNKKDSSDE
ncbi:MAG: iron-sulfur cluster-binding protein [Candidatus Schekmanbacteria bacterium RBG_13_48_7]|uniref:Iron-sulfur cluster-binding protein n=1 Tax=Candidatus Schekmanbacteria bacterium RBG_13_48_7 TaxID=1817878 RepID=A0A1F7RZU9_9BACT|nr:MAG: iron-sulfur cluster-binding protein [Candidatus Schekmanbacteria bacterium RBG_13_48_7]